MLDFIIEINIIECVKTVLRIISEMDFNLGGVTLGGLRHFYLQEYVMKKKTIYIKKPERDLSKENIPSAGPNPSIKGMRDKFWGKNCLIARQGKYIYKLT